LLLFVAIALKFRRKLIKSTDAIGCTWLHLAEYDSPYPKIHEIP
jgi:hypothetical protein